VFRLSRKLYAAILLAVLGSSALLSFLTSRYGLTASVHKPLAPSSYAAFSLLFLWAALLSIIVFNPSLGTSESRRGRLFLIGAGCAATIAIVYTLKKSPDAIWRFPSTELGVGIFRLLSLPVSILHAALGILRIEIPIYLGLMISVPTLLLTWILIATTLSKHIYPKVPRIAQPESRECFRLGSSPEATDRVLLTLSVVVGVLIRAIPLLIGSMPTGFDTSYYIGTLQDSPKLRWPETAWHRDTPVAYLILMTMGAVLRITRPLQISQVKFVELIPVALHTLCAIAAYSLTKEATGSPRSAVLASLLSSSALSQLRMSFDLYKNVLGISALAFSLEAYLLLIQTRGNSHFAATLILLCILLGIHAYPALILILTLSTYAVRDRLLPPRTRGHKPALSTTLTLFLAAAIILAPLTYRFLAESPLVDEPWPHEPTTPIFRIPVLTQEGKEFLLLTVGVAGFLYCILNGDSDAKILLAIWLLTTSVLAEQTLFQVFFEASESEKVPRFIWHLAYPNSILGAIGIIQVTSLLSNGVPAQGKPIPNHKMLTTALASATLSLLLTLHTANAVIYMSDYGPMMERSNYAAMIWLDTHSIESSGLESLYPQHMRQYLWQTHLRAPWEKVIVRDLFHLSLDSSEEYSLHPGLDRVFDAHGVQLYQQSGFFASF